MNKEELKNYEVPEGYKLRRLNKARISLSLHPDVRKKLDIYVKQHNTCINKLFGEWAEELTKDIEL